MTTPTEILQIAKSAGWLTMFQQWDEDTAYGKPVLYITPKGAQLPPRYRGIRWTAMELEKMLGKYGHMRRDGR